MSSGVLKLFLRIIALLDMLAYMYAFSLLKKNKHISEMGWKDSVCRFLNAQVFSGEGGTSAEWYNTAFLETYL